MNSSSLQLVSMFVLMVLLQVMLFNNLQLFGFINPMVYLFFIIMYRFESDQTLFILLSFILGFSIGFLCPLLIRNAFGVTAEIPTSFYNDSRTLNKTIFLALVISIHHLLYFSFVFFNWDAIYLILKNTLLASVFSL